MTGIYRCNVCDEVIADYHEGVSLDANAGGCRIRRCIAQKAPKHICEQCYTAIKRFAATEPQSSDVKEIDDD